ncbi:mechanosensitive ion channel family protein [Oceanidesulfovibrio marinus]|uniref:Mechanosensitive ion channel family protein n=1 Tax=Oceanidesulfovibrio marinus TaxID=370038 RepID=A0A6P1ZDD9_9BACT|nr:mechanosensitive ion channel family protein [Oceanidesulfovibrio marinus]QJT10404.1 mechanosensitive ion channel family protein [Oceanidesulfovibrio marinus]TVM32347.1 mechanosensitive ion channel family protein [Oceanidesulfovibrio marinus]
MNEDIQQQAQVAVDMLQKYWEQSMAWIVSGGLRILVIIILLIITLKIVGMITRRVFQRIGKGRDSEYLKRVETTRGIISFTLKVALLVVALLMILGEMGIDLGPILAAAGVIGLAVSFGAQNLVQDFISGFFMLLEDQVRVGDVVQTLGKSGVVERITLRLIVLRDLSGNVHFIRNGQIDVVTNMTKGYSYYVFDLGVAYREDVDDVVEVIKAVDEDMRGDDAYNRDILAPIEILGLDKFGDSAVIIRARTRTRPGSQWIIGREFNKRLKKAFDEHGIEIPFPHITLYPGVDKEGKAPALHVMEAGEGKAK